MVDKAGQSYDADRALDVYAAVIFFINAINGFNVLRDGRRVPVYRQPNPGLMRILLNFLLKNLSFMHNITITLCDDHTYITVKVGHPEGAPRRDKCRAFFEFMEQYDQSFLASF